MDAATATVIIEGGKLIIQSFFSYMRLAGKTAEEIDALYLEQKTQFEKNVPSQLEDP